MNDGDGSGVNVTSFTGVAGGKPHQVGVADGVQDGRGVFNGLKVLDGVMVGVVVAV